MVNDYSQIRANGFSMQKYTSGSMGFKEYFKRYFVK